MPPRRGPDTRPPAGPSTRINDAIRVETIRLIDEQGENRGEMRTQDAMEIALGLNLDLVEVAPDLSEAWNKRATAYWLMGNFKASIADICETVKREPRHFGAYSGLGMIRAEMNEPGRAVAAFELARKYNPHIVGLDTEIARLKALGGDVPADPALDGDGDLARNEIDAAAGDEAHQ